jgi:hypothetical protein
MLINSSVPQIPVLVWLRTEKQKENTYLNTQVYTEQHYVMNTVKFLPRDQEFLTYESTCRLGCYHDRYWKTDMSSHLVQSTEGETISSSTFHHFPK